MTASHVYLLTLGCPKNDADSGVLSRRLAAAGAVVTATPEGASHIVINTCGFTKEAKEESIATVLQTVAEHPEAEVAVMGCLVERYKDELKAGIPEVRHWFGLGGLPQLIDVIARAEDRAGARRMRAAPLRIAHAYIKISDGCDHLCSFCAIPGIKGPYSALKVEAIEEQVDAALDAGARELVLVGQDTTIWSDGRLDLRALVDRLAADRRVDWVRLMYLQPEHVTDDLLGMIAEHPAIVDYLDIPFQHGSRSTLARMARGGDGRAYLELLQRARRMMPGVSVRSTFIVGFPGETEAEFAELLDFAEDAAFDHAGVFVYSPEEGTAAYALRPRVPARLARERLGRLSAILASSTERATRALVGSVVEVMVDSAGVQDDLEGAVALGRTYRQAPEVDGVTYVQGGLPPGTVPGSVVRAIVTEAVGSDLVAWCETTEPS